MTNETPSAVENNPLLTVLGGVAIGAITAALLPKTRQEDKVLGTVGKDLRDRARNAANAAKDVGKEHLDNIGLNRDGATAQLRDLAAKLAQAASAAGSAAADAARKK